jgi:hypothetical protein
MRVAPATGGGTKTSKLKKPVLSSGVWLEGFVLLVAVSHSRTAADFAVRDHLAANLALVWHGDHQG